MTTINLKDFYPWYTHDEYIEVSEEVAEELHTSRRREAAHAERVRYCRVAHDDSFALEHQRFLLQLYAKQAGYTIIGAEDENGSGLTLDRPAL